MEKVFPCSKTFIIIISVSFVKPFVFLVWKYFCTRPTRKIMTDIIIIKYKMFLVSCSKCTGIPDKILMKKRPERVTWVLLCAKYENDVRIN